MGTNGRKGRNPGATGQLLVLIAVGALGVGACGDSTSNDTASRPGVSTSVTDSVVPPTTPSAAVTTTEAAATTAPAATTTGDTTTTTTTPETTTSPETTAAPEPTIALASGAPSATCVNGWTTPAPGTALRTDPLDLMRADMGLEPTDEFVVDEMRYCVGPEDTETIDPRRDVERWYVRASLQDDPSFAGRWLVRRIDIGAGVHAVAPYDSTGFEAGTWISFLGAEEGTEFSTYPGVPGEWFVGGIEEPFDPPCTADHGPFCTCDWGVGGCSCEDSGVIACTGPPPEVMGCFAGA